MVGAGTVYDVFRPVAELDDVEAGGFLNAGILQIEIIKTPNTETTLHRNFCSYPRKPHQANRCAHPHLF